MKTIDRTEYLRLVVEQYYPKTAKPTTKGWKLLENGKNMTFTELMREYKNVTKPSDKACVIIAAVEKAKNETEIKVLCDLVAKETKHVSKIINMIDIAYPDNTTATKVIDGVRSESYYNVVRKTNEIMETAKELRDIIRSFKL